MAKVRSLEIETSFGGVISEAPFENVKPLYRDKIIIDIEEGDDPAEIRKSYRKLLQDEQICEFDLLKNKLKSDLLQIQYQNIKFREKGGKQYPRVSSIIYWMKDWRISESDLAQYAARGHLIHKLCEYFIYNQIWLSLEELAEKDPECNKDITLMLSGSLKLSVDDCSHKQFFETHGKDFQFDFVEETVFNEEYFYTGCFDGEGFYKGKKSIIDLKTGSWEWKQLAAYARCRDKIEQLVICPVGPNDNKSGVKKPVVCTNIDMEFNNFLKDRAEFKKRFGI